MTDGPTAPRSEPQGPDTRPAADSQDEALAFLTQGVSYGDASATVERTDTHCSVIFLVGERAFKMKRAVVFSYLWLWDGGWRRRCTAGFMR